MKIKESEKRDKLVDFARELKKKTSNMNVTVITVLIGALGTISKSLVKGLVNIEIRGQVNTIQTTESFR